MLNKFYKVKDKGLNLANKKVEIEGTNLKEILKQIYLPLNKSHKGQNGRLLVIGGSRLFHSASIWAARVASYFVDIVHYSSIYENNQVFLSLKKEFLSGIVIERKDLLYYVKEDDCILIGPGMVRGRISKSRKNQLLNIDFSSILEIKNEAEFTFSLIHFLLRKFPEKKFVIDAGALQMLEISFLSDLKVKPILTPHKKEFEMVFKKNPDFLKKKEFIELAKSFNCVILLKRIEDWISDGENFIRIKGGNSGLTKGGTGDVLSGLTAALYTKNNPLVSTVLSSYLIKEAAYKLFQVKAYWYNIDDIIETIPRILTKLLHGL